jgi:aminoglycoside phosphotransferase (APT) family kinase protein
MSSGSGSGRVERRRASVGGSTGRGLGVGVAWRRLSAMADTAVPLKNAPFLELTKHELRAIVDRHGITVDFDAVHRLESMGIVHSIYALGNELVLRVPKAHPDALADAYTGSVAAPAAVAAGVSTPRLLVFDESFDVVPVPFSIFERVHAEPLSASLGPHPQTHGSAWHALGRELATLHGNVSALADPHGYLDPHTRMHDHEPLITDLQRDGLLGDEAATWAHDALRRLQPAVPPPDRFRRFLHGDITATNVLVRDNAFRSLIDWDDAGWGDPAMDFVSLPLRVIDATLAGYRSVAPLDGDDTAEQRILWDKLIGALQRLRLPPEPPTSPAWPTPSGRLFDIVAAAADGQSPIMRHLHLP